MSRRSLAVGFAAALVVVAALAWIEWKPQPRRRVGDELRYLERAEALAAGQVVAPDLLWPPLYSHLVAGLIRATGSSRGAVVLAQLALLALAAWLIRDLAGRLGGSPWAADLAGLLVVAYPPLTAFAFYLWPDVVHLALFAFVLWVLAAHPDHRGWLAAMGLALGLALLTKSLLGPFLPALLVPVLLAPAGQERPWRRGLLSTALVAAVALATVLPTILAHGRATGSYVIADSSRFNLWVGLNDDARKDISDRRVGEEHASFEAGGATFEERNRVLDGKIRRLLAEQGWLPTLAAQLSRQYFRLFDEDSLLTDQLPGGALAERGRGYRRPPPAVATLLRAASYSLYALILAAAPLGLLLDPPGRRAWAWLPPAFFAYNLVIFLGLHVKSRYAAQLVPLLILYAALALGALADGQRRRELAALPRWKLAAAGLAAALLLFLAFGGGLLGG